MNQHTETLLQKKLLNAERLNEHLKAILADVARDIHDGHDQHDANKQHGWGAPPIPFESCTRPTCSKIREAIAESPASLAVKVGARS